MTAAPIGLRDLRAFVAVAEELSFARGAERLCVAQPALSRRIARLEDALGFRLFTRTTRTVALTAAGAVFLSEARAVLERMGRAIEAAGRADRGEAGAVRVGYNDFAISGPLPDVVRAFRAGTPGVTVQLARGSSEAQIERLAAGEIDVAFVIAGARAQGAERRTVWRERFVAVMPEGHRLSARASVALRDLAEAPHVLGERAKWAAYRDALRRLYAPCGTFPPIAAEGPDTPVVLGLVAAGVGVTVYPECVENAMRRGMVLRPIEDAAPTLDTAMLWRPGADRAVGRFVDTALECAERWPGGHYRGPFADADPDARRPALRVAGGREA